MAEVHSLMFMDHTSGVCVIVCGCALKQCPFASFSDSTWLVFIALCIRETMSGAHRAFEGAGSEPGLLIWRIEVSFLCLVTTIRVRYFLCYFVFVSSRELYAYQLDRYRMPTQFLVQDFSVDDWSLLRAKWQMTYFGRNSRYYCDVPLSCKWIRLTGDC